jgi:hypothetical protein
MDSAAGPVDPPVSTATLRGWLAALPGLVAVDDADRVDQLRLLEEIKAATAAAQARVAVDFDTSQRRAQEAAGVPVRRVGAGIAAQIALARRDSPHHGGRHLGLARALLTEMPHTLDALTRGQISEWRATLLVRETACLTRADRTRADAELATTPGGLAALGDTATVAAVRRVGYRLDPHAFTARAAKATTDRHLTLRPAPDTMTYLSGLLPVTQGVAAYAALSRHADTLRAAGDHRTRGQIMADTLVERVTGQTTATAVPVEIALVMTDHTLLDPDPHDHHHDDPVNTPHDTDAQTTADEPGQEPVHVPAYLPGYGPVPAPLARDWLRQLLHHGDAPIWLRRVFTRPEDGTLVTMDSTRRAFTGRLATFLKLRDQHTCRTPWCGAPLRHLDHPRRAADGGPTTATNAQGLCEACNYTKDTPGWHTHTTTHHTDQTGTPTGTPTGIPTVETTTPTGHTYTSHPPRPPGGTPHEHPPTNRDAARPPTRLETSLRDLILTA